MDGELPELKIAGTSMDGKLMGREMNGESERKVGVGYRNARG